MIGTLDFQGMKEKELDGIRSSYQPPKDIADFTGLVVKPDYVIGHNNLHRPYRELNDLSVIQRMNVDQPAFNSYVEPPSLDPEDQWRFFGVRPLTRNAVMVMAAQMTARILFPNVFAQNATDESDKLWGNVMRDVVLWNIENSNYERSVLFAVISALVNPCAYVMVDYMEATQIIRQRLENGEIEIKEAIDEVFSGLQYHNIPVDEILIANPYGGINIQRQRFIIRRRFIERTEAKSVYGNHPNFIFVQDGVKAIFNDQDGMFYDQRDTDNPTIIEEVLIKYRQDDIEVPFINGIYMGDVNLENNPIRHRDNKNKPWYNLAHFGYHPIDEGQFFWFKSLVFTMENEQDFSDTLIRMTVDGTFMSLAKPLAVSGGVTGDGKIDGSVMFPGAVTFFDRDTTITPIDTGIDFNAGYAAIEKAEQMAQEDSVPEALSGQLPDPQQKAFSVARAETNARIKMSIFRNNIASMVEQIGALTIDDVLTHQTVGEFDEILGGVTKLKYRTFVLSDQSDRGQKVTKKIVFTDSLIGAKKTKDEKLRSSFMILSKEKMDGDERIVNVNPQEFRTLKFKIQVNPEAIIPRSEELEDSLRIRAWERMIQSPFADREMVDRDFLFETFAQGESDKYMKKASEIMGTPEGGAPSTARKVAESVVAGQPGAEELLV